ncbi:beta strand repeat-containing protein [Shimia ponticola]|uniref:beta strand repeat-containing protein n=1 Tax=Shimia ponticola TaxID=2582893 RepID=UPI0011BF4841|nr:hypothetical protein [Shimia ponticola]
MVQSKSLAGDASARALQGALPVSLPRGEGARRKALRSLAKANKMAMAAGTTAFVLVLLSAEGAAAQAASGPVSVAGVEGVASVAVQADGTVLVTMDNGQQYSLPAEAVTIAADGTVLVSAAIAEGLAATGAGAVAAGPSSAMLAGLGAGGLALAAAGGGGGGGDDGGSGGGSAAPVPAGTVVDGYLVGATVFRDANGNGQLDEGEFSTTTDQNGEWSLALDPSAPDAQLISIGGIDRSTGETFTGVLTGPADATVLTPITTLVQALIEEREAAGTPVSAEDAAAEVATALGLDGQDILDLDPVELAEGGDLEALQLAAQIAAVINVAAGGSEDDQAASSSVASSLVNSLLEDGADALTDEQAIEDALLAAGLDADLADAAAGAVQDANELIGDAEDLQGITDVQEVVQGDLVEGTEDGDVGDINVGDAVDAVVPLVPTVNSELDALLGGDEGTVTISGTGKVGSTVRVTIADVVYTTVVTENTASPTTDADAPSAAGVWSIDIDLSDFDTDGTFDVEVAAAFAGTTTFTDPVDGGSVEIDTTGPAVTLNTVSGDDTISGAELLDSVSITGTTEAGASVVVGFGDASQTVTADEDGNFEAVFARSDIPDAGTATVTATATDALGNEGDAATSSVTVEELDQLTVTMTVGEALNMFGSDFTDEAYFLDGGLNSAFGDDTPDATSTTLTYTGSDGTTLVFTGTDISVDPLGGVITSVTLTGATEATLTPLDTAGGTILTIDGLLLAVEDLVSIATSVREDSNLNAWYNMLDDYARVVNGSEDRDYLAGSPNADVINGLGGNDIIFAGAGDDTVNGGGGRDYIIVTEGNNTIDGGASGEDQVSYEDAANGVNVNLEAGTATNGSFTDTISNVELARGSAFDDTIVGVNNGDDFSQISGLAGNDTLTGGTGTNDMLDYSRDEREGGTSGVTVNLQTGTATDGFGDTDTISGFEEVNGTGFDDDITVEDTVSGRRWIDMGDGDDRFTSALETGRDENVGVRTGDGEDTVVWRGGRLHIDDFDTSKDKLEFSDEMLALFATANVSEYSGEDDNGPYSGVNFWIEEEDGTIHSLSFNDLTLEDINDINIVNEIEKQTFTGTDGDDTFRSGLGDDTFLGSANDREDEFFAGFGDDTFDYTGLTGSNRQIINYGDLDGSFTFELDYAANTGTVESDVFGSDTIINLLGAALHADGDGQLTIVDGRGDDTVNLTMSETSFTETVLRWGGGSDSYNITVGAGYLELSFGRAESIDLNLADGEATATRERGDETETSEIDISITGENDDFELSVVLTEGDDTFTGSDRDERVVGRGGNDVADGGDGYDIFRTDWDDFGSVTVDLSGTTQTVTGTYDGEAFTATVSNFEEFRGSQQNDTMIAGDDGVRFRGRDGDDTLTGGAGDDILEGDDGDDIYTGGAGADRFVLEQGHDIIMDFNPAEGDDLDGNGPFEVDDPSQVTITDTTVNGQAAVTIGIDDDNSLTLVGFTQEDVLALFSDDNGNGGNNGVRFNYTPPPSDSVLVTLNQPVDLFRPLIDGTFNGVSEDSAGTNFVLSFDYQGESYEYSFIGTNFDVSLSLTGDLDPGANSTIESMSFSIVSVEPPQQLAEVTNMDMAGRDVIELIDSAIDNDGTITASGTAFGDSGRAVVIVGSGPEDDIAIDGVTTYIFTGGSDDTVFAGENHDGFNIISVEEGGDTVIINPITSADTYIIIDTDGTNASEIIDVQGFRVGSSEDDGGDLFVIESQDGYDMQFVGFTQGDVNSLADLDAALNDPSVITFDQDQIGEFGFVLVQDGQGNGTVASFIVDENARGQLQDIHAHLTDMSLNNIDDITTYEFMQYIEDTPDAPDFA